jgi:hypothetical protein
MMGKGDSLLAVVTWGAASDGVTEVGGGRGWKGRELMSDEEKERERYVCGESI